MGRHKEMIGTAYKIVSQDESGAIIDYTYFCLHCERDTTVRGSVSQEGLALVNSGAFYELLDCGYCGKRGSIRFHGLQFPQAL